MAEDMEEDVELTEAEAADLAAIRARKKQIVANHRLKKGAANNQAILPQRARAERRLTTENMKVRRSRVHIVDCIEASRNVALKEDPSIPPDPILA